MFLASDVDVWVGGHGIFHLQVGVAVLVQAEHKQRHRPSLDDLLDGRVALEGEYLPQAARRLDPCSAVGWYSNQFGNINHLSGADQIMDRGMGKHEWSACERLRR